LVDDDFAQAARNCRDRASTIWKSLKRCTTAVLSAFRRSDPAVAFFTMLLVVVVGLQTEIISKQTQIISKTDEALHEAADASQSAAATAKAALEFSSRSFKEEQRAYLWASSFNMSTPPICQVPGGVHICADVHIVNSGRTPAIGVRIHRYATFGPDAVGVIKAIKIASYTSPAGDMLGTVGDKWGTAATDAVDDPTVKDILNGKISIYIYGVVQYYDIFSDYHETGFCAFRLPNNGPFIACEFGNWFDKR